MDLRAMVAKRIPDLQRFDIAALQSLPAHHQEANSSEDKVKISRYHEVAVPGEHKVVVQAIRRRLLGLITAIEVDGFVVAKDGTRRSLTEHEKWPYL